MPGCDWTVLQLAQLMHTRDYAVDPCEVGKYPSTQQQKSIFWHWAFSYSNLVAKQDEKQKRSHAYFTFAFTMCEFRGTQRFQVIHAEGYIHYAFTPFTRHRIGNADCYTENVQRTQTHLSTFSAVHASQFTLSKELCEDWRANNKQTKNPNSLIFFNGSACCTIFRGIMFVTQVALDVIHHTHRPNYTFYLYPSEKHFIRWIKSCGAWWRIMHICI